MSQEQKEQYQPPKEDDQEDGDEESKEELQLTSVYAINPSINYDESQSLAGYNPLRFNSGEGEDQYEQQPSSSQATTTMHVF